MIDFIMQNLFLNAGLSGITENLKNNWIGPVFIIIVAAISIKFLLQREIRSLLIFLVIAAIVGVLIYFGSSIVGQNGSLSNFAKNQANTINTILAPRLDMLRSLFL